MGDQHLRDMINAHENTIARMSSDLQLCREGIEAALSANVSYGPNPERMERELKAILAAVSSASEPGVGEASEAACAREAACPKRRRERCSARTPTSTR